MGALGSEAAGRSLRADRLRAWGVALTAVAVAAAACTGIPLPGFRDPSAVRWRQVTTELRELEFLRPVGLRWIDSVEIPDLIREELEAAFPEAVIDDYRDAYAAMGLLPVGFDLLEVLLELQQDQLVGFYSARREVLYVLRDLPPGGFTPTTVVVHELVHALQHQHHPLPVSVLQGLMHNDDVVAALGAAIEGDASFTMLGLDSAEHLPSRDLDGAAELRDAMLVDVEHPTGLLASVPRLLRLSLIFPYAYGTVVAAHRYADAGNAGLDALVQDAPLSTLRVLDPNGEGPVEFLRLPLEALAGALEARGCEVGDHNVAGALGLRVLFEDHGSEVDAAAVADGWAGDRFAHLHCGSVWELVWVTRWKDEELAGTFARRYSRVAESVAASTPLSGPATAIQHGRTVLVLTPGLVEQAELILRGMEVRSYDRFVEWLADGCFPEPSCPKEAAAQSAGQVGLRQLLERLEELPRGLVNDVLYRPDGVDSPRDLTGQGDAGL